MATDTCPDPDVRAELAAELTALVAAEVAARVAAQGSLAQLLAGLDDGWEGHRQALHALAADRGEWAGYPLLSEYFELEVEPRHPLYATLQGQSLRAEPPADSPVALACAGAEALVGEPLLVNHWVDYGREREVYLLKDTPDGRVYAQTLPRYTCAGRAKFLLDTLGASQVWSAGAELTALRRLKTLVTVAAFRYYLLTGTFLETSPRSQVTYLFRKNRPTLALAKTLHGDDMRVLAALCLHPIGHYRGTYAGSLVPTDDVIAHLVLMRGDERKFWSKANQHDPRCPEAGL